MTPLRRYRLPSLLFLICLVVVLLSGELAWLPAATAASPALSPTASPTVTPKVSPSPKASPKANSGPKANPSPTPALSSLSAGVRKTVLGNGMTVLTKEVPTAPVVTVQVWYRVGSRDEAPGVNGIAHQLEHLMFKGTQARPIQFGRLFSALGSQSNAFTSYDQTAYFGTVERDKMRALLEIEADRMLNSRIDQSSLASENKVVISELQGYENSPSYRLNRAVQRRAFPGSTYGLTVGGTKADVQAFTVEQVRWYYQNYYRPDNATLILVGDFQTEPTLQAVKEIFSKLPNPPKGKTPLPVTPSTQAAEKALIAEKATKNSTPIVLKEPGTAPLLQVVYPLPDAKSPDIAAIQVLDLVLTQGRNSRLYQALVESGLASGFSAGPTNLLTQGWYELSATAAQGKDLKTIDAVALKAIAAVQTGGVTAEELQRAKTQLKASTLLRNRDIAQQAQQLGYDLTTSGDYQQTDRLLAAAEKVTAQQVQQAAQKYLKSADRTIGFFEPTQLTGPSATAPSGKTAEQPDLGPPVDPAEIAKYIPVSSNADRRAPVLPDRFTLSNGIKVLLLKDTSNPTMTLAGNIKAGSDFDSTAKAGLAQLTSGNLLNGTTTRDALTLAKTLDDRGLELGASVNREGARFGAQGLASDLPILLDLLSDVVQNATFPGDKFELTRQRALVGLKAQLDSPNGLARRTFQQTVYPSNHPYYSFPTKESLEAITQADLVQFYKQHYRPDSTILSLVGNFDPDQVKQLLEQKLGSWKATGSAPSLTFPPVELPTKSVRLSQSIPGKAQSVSFLGYVGITRQDSRFYAAEVLNQILGGDTLSSRLGTEIRDRQGLTYGIYSYFQTGTHAGPFLVSMQTAPEDAGKAIDSTVKLLKQLQEQGVTTSEVVNAIRSITSNYPVELANPGALAGVMLSNELYGLNVGELRQFPEQIAAVTQAQVNEAAKALLQPDRLVVVTAGPPLK